MPDEKFDSLLNDPEPGGFPAPQPSDEEVIVVEPKRVEIKPPHEEALPEDIEAIWGVSPESRKFAETLIEAWGIDVFRTSSTHSLAIEEAAREEKLAPVRLAFVKQHAKSAKQAVDDTNPVPEDPR